MAAFKARKTKTGYAFVIPKDAPPEQQREAVLDIVLQLWQNRVPMVATPSRVLSEDSNTAWLLEADVRLLPMDTALEFPAWLPPSAKALATSWNEFRASWGPWWDRFASFRDLGLKLLRDLGYDEQGLMQQMDTEGWRYFPRWGLRAPGAEDDPRPDDERGLARSVNSKMSSPSYWRSLGLPVPEPPPEDWEPCFIRLGPPPEDGEHSVCIGFGFKEKGMSCFRGYRTPEGDYYADLGMSHMLGNYWVRRLEKLKPYILEGEVVGQGVGSEVVLKPVRSYDPLPDGTSVRPYPELPKEYVERQHRKVKRGQCMEHQTFAEVFWVFEWLHDAKPGITGSPPEPVRLLSDECEGIQADTFWRLLQAVLPYGTETARISKIHGETHMRRVWLTGEQLCEATPGADKHVVRLFAALHDTYRSGDGRDPRHGHYAAKGAEFLREEGIIEATDEQMIDLLFALRRHDKGTYIGADEPTIGVCWDADRLDLPRCGKKVNPSFLSTEAAKEMLEARVA